ncbi:MAG: DUF4282 domain-containing protein [Cyanobacteria bacterium J06598_1]
MTQNKGFFARLFDLSFSSFIAPQIVGILYVLGLVGATLFALKVVQEAFRWLEFTEGVGTLVVTVISLFIYAILSRVALESFVAIIRTAESTRILAEEAIARQNNGTTTIS